MTKTQAIDERDGALHLLNDLRGRDADMLRLLTNAMDGLTADPPYTTLTIERIQTCIDQLKIGVK